MTIKDQLLKVNDTDRAALFYAFEQEQPYYVRLSDGSFIGVNITNEPCLIIELKQGVWSVGTWQTK